MARETGIVIEIVAPIAPATVPTKGFVQRDDTTHDPVTPEFDDSSLEARGIVLKVDDKVSFEVGADNIARNIELIPQPPSRTIEITADTTETIFVFPGNSLVIKNNAKLTGSVTLKGATLNMESGTTITGDLVAIARSTVALVNATINGDVDVFDGVSFSKTGGSLGGALMIKRTKNLTLSGGTYADEIIIRRSGPAVSITGITTTNKADVRVLRSNNVTVTGNTVDGDLIIRGTTGTCTGQPNTVAGRKVICQP